MSNSGSGARNSALIFGDGEWGGLVRAFEKSPQQSGCAWSLRAGGYDSWLREVADPSSDSRKEADRVWIFMLSPRVLENPELEVQVDSLLALLEEAASSRSVFFGTLYADPSAPLSLSHSWESAERAEIINTKLRAFRRKHSWFNLLDVATFVQKAGFESLYDARFEATARYIYHPGALDRLAAWVLRHLEALDRVPAKVIALDLDNTLWGGVLGEDGPEGIRIGPHGAGLHYWRFQRYLKQLQEAGFLLVILSKNNLGEVEEIFRNHPDMYLKWDDFSAHAVNWKSKSENLKELAGQLGLGTDSFLFVDDSDHERGQMQAELPEVKIFAFPSDPSKLSNALAECHELDRLRTSAEDRERSRSYAETAKRSALQATSTSLEDYYAALQLRVEAKRATPENEARLHQLLLKTNQFNLTAERPDASEFRRRLSDKTRKVWSLRVSDRIGDSGLTGLIEIDLSQASHWVVKNFLLSCRVLGRTVEFAVLAWICAEAAKSGAQTLSFEFKKTGRNQPALDFIEQSGARISGTVAQIDLDSQSLAKLPPHRATLSTESRA